jgi:hypothetical protein
MRFTDYKNVVIEPELGVDVDQVADEVMKKMAGQGWQVISVSPHTRPGKLLVTFGKPADEH